MSKTPVTKITRGWRITIPPESRDGLKVGDIVIFAEGCIKKAKIVEESSLYSHLRIGGDKKKNDSKEDKKG